MKVEVFRPDGNMLIIGEDVKGIHYKIDENGQLHNLRHPKAAIIAPPYEIRITDEDEGDGG